jgi:flavodoxin
MAESKKKLADRPNINNQVLLVYYSFSGQTGVLINRLAAGLKDQGIEVCFEKLKPLNTPHLPHDACYIFPQACPYPAALF